MNGNTGMQLAGGAPVMVAPVRAGFTPEQRKLILDTCCGGAPETEAAVLVAIAEARGLNPLLGECYFVKRWDSQNKREVWSVQASIDSFRIKAEETGDYGGQDAPTFEYDEGGNVTVARVAVYRRSVHGRPFAVGEARWAEYVQLTKEQKPTRFWANMPHNQLAKCAEAQALRKAFPKVLAKLYTPEEMAQADGKDDGAKAEPAHDPETGEVQDKPKGKGVNTGLFRAMAAKIRACVDANGLAAAAAEVVAEVKAGRITTEQREKLKAVYAETTAKLAKAEVPKSSPEPVEAEDPREAEYEAEASAHD